MKIPKPKTNINPLNKKKSNIKISNFKVLIDYITF